MVRVHRFAFGCVLLGGAATLFGLGFAGCDLDQSGRAASSPDANPADVGSCATPKSTCGTACVDLQQDTANCGQCGLDCRAGGSKTAVCVDGACVTCPSGMSFDADPLNCGQCGRSCFGAVCAGGKCAPSAVATVPNNLQPMALAADDTAVYFTAQHTLLGNTQSVIARASSQGDGGAPTTFLGARDLPYDIHIYGGVLVWTERVSIEARWLDDSGAPYSRNAAASPASVAWAPKYLYWTADSPVLGLMKDTMDQTGYAQVTPGNTYAKNSGIVADDASVYFANSTGMGVFAIDSTDAGSALRKLAPTINRASTVSFRVAVDGTNVYWTEPSSAPGGSDGRVLSASKANTDAASPQVVATGERDPTFIVASDDGFVYWTDFGTPNGNDGAVVRSRADGSERTVLASGQRNPLGIAIAGKFVYWASSTPGGSIFRVWR